MKRFFGLLILFPLCLPTLRSTARARRDGRLAAALVQIAKTTPGMEAGRSLWNKLDKQTADPKVFTVEGHKYEFHHMTVTNLDDSRYGLALVWVKIPAREYDLAVVDVRRDADIGQTFESIARPDKDIVLMNGGYFLRKDSIDYAPMGLLIADGVPTSKIWPWNSGGVLFVQSENSPIRIVPIKDFQNTTKPFQALQSKPLLVEHSQMGIRTEDHQLANRTTVAICSDGTVLLAGVFADGGATSLYEFAALLKSGKLDKSPIEYALNMDGGPGAHIFIPALHLHFGSNTTNYVPNVIRLRGTRR